MLTTLMSAICLAASSSPPTVEQIADALQTTQSQIRTIHLNLRLDLINPGETAPNTTSTVAYSALEYWRRDDRSHWRAKCKASTDDFYSFDGRMIRILNFAPDSSGHTLPPNAHLRIPKQPNYEDVPSLLMWTIGFMPLGASMTAPGARAEVSRVAGTDAKVSVRWRGPAVTATAVFNQTLNWAAEELTLHYDNDSHGELSGHEFADRGAGVFVPGRVSLKAWGKYASRDHFFTLVAHIDQVTVNAGDPASDVVPRYPPGCNLVDEIAGKQYAVDQTGRQVGPTRDIIPATPLPLPPVPNTVTVESDRSWVWPVLATVSFAIAAGGLYLLRTRRG